jgi:hypothetical protein
MFNINEEKDRLAKNLAEQYSQNIISLEEYERILEYLNKIETKKEIYVIEKIIYENTGVNKNELETIQDNEIMTPKSNERHLTIFSWRSLNIKPANGNGGKHTSLFGTNRIIVDNPPDGKLVLNVNSIFGLTEIIVPKNIKIINKAVPIFSGIFVSEELMKESEELPELYIFGNAIFGNITIKTAEEKAEEMRKEKEFEEKHSEKIKEKMLKNIKY